MTDVTSEIHRAANVLIAVPSMGGSNDVCTSLLAEGLETPNVLYVSFTRSADACVGQWDDGGREAANIGVITVGDGSSATTRGDVATRNVGSPSDLTGLGIELGQALSEWSAPVAVCFDSLTAMLQYVDFETAYEFLHALTGQIHAADARAHFHIDPEAHDATQVAAIESLCDASIRLGDGEPEVRTRDVVQ